MPFAHNFKACLLGLITLVYASMCSDFFGLVSWWMNTKLWNWWEHHKCEVLRTCDILSHVAIDNTRLCICGIYHLSSIAGEVLWKLILSWMSWFLGPALLWGSSQRHLLTLGLPLSNRVGGQAGRGEKLACASVTLRTGQQSRVSPAPLGAHALML